MILVLFAMPQECRDFVRRLARVKATDGGWEGEWHGKAVTVVLTGMGHRAATEAARRAVERLQPSLVISSGFAGGLGARLATGDLISGANFSDPTTLDLLPPQVQKVQLFSSPVALDSPEAKRAAHAQSEADAVDMETAAISAVCHAAGRPLLSLRVISDADDESLPLPSAVTYDLEGQRIRTFAIVAYLLTHPAAIPRLIRFVRSLAPLEKKLADALVRTIENHATHRR